MTERHELAAAADLFRSLASESRLELLLLLAGEPMSVSALVERTGRSQPLVSQHLRALRAAGLVASEASGRERIYRLADHHVAHVIADAVEHAGEHPHPEGAAS